VGISNAQVAIDARGNALAVWQDTPTAVAAWRPAGASWGAPQVVGVSATADSVQAAIAPDGNALALWRRAQKLDDDSGSEVVEAASRPAGGDWSAPKALSSTSPGLLYGVGQPHVAVDARGKAMAVWERISGADVIVEAAWRPAHEDWGEPAKLSIGRGEAAPRVALDARGNAVAVWQLTTEPPPQGSNEPGTAHAFIQAAARPAGGGWSRPQRLSPGNDSFSPEVAVDAKGNAVAVWWNTSQRAIQASHRPAGRRWSPPQVLSRQTESEEHPYPDVALDARGNPVAVWWRSGEPGSDNYTVHAARRRPGRGWGAPERIGQASGGLSYASPPQVAVDAQGNSVAVWVARRHGYDSDGVQAARRPVDGSWRAPEQLSAPGEQVDRPKIALNSRGEGVAVWTARRRVCNPVCNEPLPTVRAVALRAAGPAARAGARRSSCGAGDCQRTPAALSDETGVRTLAVVLIIIAVLVLAALLALAMRYRKRRQRLRAQAHEQ
jgi:hypothetical protein